MSRRFSFRLLPWITALAGLALTAYAWHAARLREDRAVAARFHAEAAQLGRAAAWEIALFVDVLQSLGTMHALSDQVSAKAFEEFAGVGLTHQSAVLGAFGFAQWIPATLRAALEEPGPDGHPMRQLTEFGDGATLRRADHRSDYFPLTYQHPASALGLPNDLDLTSLPGAREAIARMALSGRPALGPRTPPGLQPLGATEPGPPGYYVFAPIHPVGEPAALSGFTLAILWPQELLRRALDRTLARGIQITLFDPTDNTPPADEATLLRREESLALADVAWVLRCEAMPSYGSAHATHLPWLALAAGLSITLLLTLQTAGLVRRADRIEALVRERTAELEEANRRLAGEMQERARLEVEIDEVADREKRRLGHDLHDSLGQKLTGAVYLSKALSGSLGTEAGEARAAAEKINDILKDAVAEVRRTARGLAPVEVGEAGLAQALRGLAEEACSVYGIACSFRSAGEPRLRDARMAVQLYHIAQEALTNAVRHGGAREVELRLESTPSGGQLAIRDNGRGFAPAATGNQGAGLRIMRHRARTIGGQLAIQSAPGAGAVVTCHF